MRRQLEHSYEFGPFRLDISERVVLHNGEIVPLTTKAFDPLSKLDVVASPSPRPLASPATALTTGTIDEPRRSAWKIIVGAGALVAIGAFGLWLYKFLTRPVVPFQTIRMAKLTNTGN